MSVLMAMAKLLSTLVLGVDVKALVRSRNAIAIRASPALIAL